MNGAEAHNHNQAILFFYSTYSIRGLSSDPLHEQDTRDPLHCGAEQDKPGYPSSAVLRCYWEGVQGKRKKSKKLSGDGAASPMACGLSSERKVIRGKV